MTSDQTEAGRRFADDLRRIRESRGLDRAKVVADLKLDPSILDAFEESGLVNHPMYNRVYLRSFLSGYARALSIPFDAVSEALDQVFAGRYRGSLGIRFLGDPEPESGTTIHPDPVEPTVPARRGGNRPRAATPEPPAATAAAPPQLSRAVTIRRPRLWAGLGLAAIALSFGGWWFLTDRAAQPVTPQTPAILEEAAPIAAPVRTVVPDTMRLHLVALDSLNPIRVIVDEKLRAPYWIEVGDSMAFDVTRRIVFERRAERVALSYDGRRIPVVGVDSTGTLTLTRERVQEILDSLRTAG